MELYDQLVILIGILFFIYLTPLFFVAADLWSGIRKAKERNEMITSYKSRRTIYKITRYYACLLALTVLDALLISVLWYGSAYHDWKSVLFPFLTLIGAIGIGIIEVKSIIEPATAKERKLAKEVADLAKKLIEGKGDAVNIATAISDYLIHKSDE